MVNPVYRCPQGGYHTFRRRWITTFYLVTTLQFKKARRFGLVCTKCKMEASRLGNPRAR